MKTPQEIIKWCDMMIKRHPNVVDLNYFNSIKKNMEKLEKCKPNNKQIISKRG